MSDSYSSYSDAPRGGKKKQVGFDMTSSSDLSGYYDFLESSSSPAPAPRTAMAVPSLLLLLLLLFIR